MGYQLFHLQLQLIQWWNWSIDKITKNIALIAGADIKSLKEQSLMNEK